MKRPELLLVLALLIPVTVPAAEHAAGGSAKDYSYLTEDPAAAGTRSDRCAKLAREVEALRGKPQRRYTAEQRYELECER